MRRLSWFSELGSLPRIVSFGALFLVVLLLVFPYKTVIVPDWNLKVVDERGAPVRAINVTEHWQHYLLEDVGHEELQKTGDDGMVSFSSRTIRASLLRRGLASFQRIAGKGLEANRGPYASVVVWGNSNYSTDVAVYEKEKLLPSEIVVHSVR